MKLDLLYEIDSPRPWEGGPHPYGQRQREQRAYYEMLEQIEELLITADCGAQTTMAILDRLRAGPVPVNALAADFHQSRPAISKHLKVLERAGLISRRREATRRLSHPRGRAAA